MNKYCRYCSYCVAQDDDNAACIKNNVMVSKTSIRNNCKSFDFNEIDAFNLDKKYHPREHQKKQCDGQMSLF